MKKVILGTLVAMTTLVSFGTSAKMFWSCATKDSLLMSEVRGAILSEDEAYFIDNTNEARVFGARLLEVKEHNGKPSYVIDSLVAKDDIVQTDYIQARIFFGSEWRMIKASFVTKEVDGTFDRVLASTMNKELLCEPSLIEPFRNASNEKIEPQR